MKERKRKPLIFDISTKIGKKEGLGLALGFNLQSEQRSRLSLEERRVDR
jgi:hypothetical protein